MLPYSEIEFSEKMKQSTKEIMSSLKGLSYNEIANILKEVEKRLKLQMSL